VKGRRRYARELLVGDVVVTAIGRAPVTAIVPDRGGLAVHLDVRHERSTRPGSETSILWLYPGERIAIRARDRAPSLNAARVRGQEVLPLFQRRSTGLESRTQNEGGA
jgi:hypothetical protein